MAGATACRYLITVGLPDHDWRQLGQEHGQMRQAEGLALDNTGNLYIAELLNHRIQKFALGIPGWVQTNINGFGDLGNTSIGSLDALNGQMYAGTWANGTAQVWRTSDGQTWSQITSTWSASNTAVFDAQAYGGYLYFGTSNDNGGEIWRTNGMTWTQVISGGLGDRNNYGISALAVFSNAIYAAPSNVISGTRVWRSANWRCWQLGESQRQWLGGGVTAQDVAMDVYDGHLYVGIGRGGYITAELWRTSDGTTWTPVFTNGLAANNTNVSAMAEFNGNFYIALRNVTTGGEVWRSDDGLSWTPGHYWRLGNGANGRPYGLLVFDNRLYVMFSNLNTGAEIWRTTDGNTWERVSTAGWGDSNNGYVDYLTRRQLFSTTVSTLAPTTAPLVQRFGKRLSPLTLLPVLPAAPPPLAVVFTNTSAGDYTTAQWDFGNGQSYSGTLPLPQCVHHDRKLHCYAHRGRWDRHEHGYTQELHSRRISGLLAVVLR